MLWGVLETFNLVIIHEPGPDNWRWARNQLRQVLGSEGRLFASYQSVMLYSVDGDPHQVADRLRESLKGATPVIRVIPVDHVVEPYLDSVVNVVKDLAVRMPEGSSFRITLQGHLIGEDLRGRRRLMHTIDSIREIAKYVDRPVDLESPDWVILIKVVRISRSRRAAAVALLKPAELVNLRDLPDVR